MNIPGVIIGIILSVLALAIGVMMFGDFFDSGSSKAIGAQASNEAQQIVNSVNLYKSFNDGQLPVDSSTGAIKIQTLLDENYLDTVPKDWAPAPDSIRKTNDRLSNNACLEVNKTIGIKQETVPQCGDSILDGKRFYCCDSS